MLLVNANYIKREFIVKRSAHICIYVVVKPKRNIVEKNLLLFLVILCVDVCFHGGLLAVDVFVNSQPS